MVYLSWKKRRILNPFRLRKSRNDAWHELPNISFSIKLVLLLSFLNRRGSKLFTKYNNLDLLELFWSEAESLTGEMGDGEVLYRRAIGDFKLTLFIYSYEMKCNVFLSYKNEDILSIELDNISELRKNEDQLYFISSESVELCVTFGKVFSVKFEDK